MSAEVNEVYNAYCADCADGAGPFDDWDVAETWVQDHNKENHDEA